MHTPKLLDTTHTHAFILDTRTKIKSMLAYIPRWYTICKVSSICDWYGGSRRHSATKVMLKEKHQYNNFSRFFLFSSTHAHATGYTNNSDNKVKQKKRYSCACVCVWHCVSSSGFLVYACLFFLLILPWYWCVCQVCCFLCFSISLISLWSVCVCVILNFRIYQLNHRTSDSVVLKTLWKSHKIQEISTLLTRPVIVYKVCDCVSFVFVENIRKSLHEYKCETDNQTRKKSVQCFWIRLPQLASSENCSPDRHTKHVHLFHSLVYHLITSTNASNFARSKQPDFRQ